MRLLIAMAATVFELLLAHVAQLHEDEGFVVHRALVDEIAPGVDGFVTVHRGGTTRVTPDAIHAGVDEHDFSILVRYAAQGSQWETLVDDMHQRGHAAMQASEPLAVRDFQLQSTNPEGAAGDPITGVLACTYTLTAGSSEDLLAEL